MPSLLWIEDDPALRRVLGPLLRAEGYEVREAADETAAAIALAQSPDLVLLDLMLPPSQTPAEGLALLDRIVATDATTKVVVLTGTGGRQVALDAIRRGAHDFLAKPVDPDVLLVVLARAAARVALEREVAALRARVAGGDGILGHSPVLLAAKDLVDRVAPTDLPVLLGGEPGTGKELFARRVHAQSRRASRPFVAVNCGAFTPSLLESALFGHVRGAFTGADRVRRGLFVEADGGTLFLDEVGDTEPATQVRLLRALESGEILAVGADRPVHVDVRVVAATWRGLDTLVAEGRFREDLYWRLRGVEVVLPPLRDRGDDILLLARQVLGAGGFERGWTEAAATALLAHPWPGNVRELRHALGRAAVLATKGAPIDVGDLGLKAVAPDGHTLEDQVNALEVRALRAALASEGGNHTRAAERLGLSRQGLLNKLDRHRLR